MYNHAQKFIGYNYDYDITYSIYFEGSFIKNEFLLFLQMDSFPNEYESKLIKIMNLPFVNKEDSYTVTYPAKLAESKKDFIKKISPSIFLKDYNFEFKNKIENLKINPIEICKEYFLELLNCSNGSILFYTGAGISIASNIIGLKKLEEELYINNLSELLLDISNECKNVKSRYLNFLFSLYYSKPNKIHFIINKLVNEYKAELVTENRDILHQKVGTHTFVRTQLNLLKPYYKLVVVVGMSQDHQGLIEKLRKKDSEFVFIDKEYPECMKYTDYFLKFNFDSCCNITKNIVD